MTSEQMPHRFTPQGDAIARQLGEFLCNSAMPASDSGIPFGHTRGSASEHINLELRKHQVSAEWDLSAMVGVLHCFAVMMNIEFKLNIPVPSIALPSLRNALGRFRPGRNPFGLLCEIGLDERHVERDPWWHVLGTLLHLLLRVWQTHHGKPSSRYYINTELRTKARSVGLIILPRGRTEFIPGDTLFNTLLRQYGVAIPDAPTPAEAPASIGSKLKLYVCPCGVKVRVGRRCFHAMCLDCGGLFRFADCRSVSVSTAVEVENITLPPIVPSLREASA